MLNQLELLKTNLKSARDYILSKEHSVAFIGSVGVGKTTAICGILDLVDDKGGTALSTSSGRTTLCEIELRRGERPRILISPCSEGEMRNYLRDFVDLLRMRHEGKASDDGDVVAMSAEVERCMRNMIGLPARTAKAPDGTIKRTDEALELYRKIGSEGGFMDEALKRLNLERRTLTELVCDQDDTIAWIKEQFGQINHGKHPLTPMPQRIVVELANPMLGEADLNMSLIDTKGLDGNVEREDIDRQFRDGRTVCIVCSKFNDAPEQSVQELMRHLIDSGLSQQLTEQTVLLVLDRNQEAANTLAEDGPVGSAEEGRVVRESQIQDTLRTRLKLADRNFPRIRFFDAKQNEAADIKNEIRQKVAELRRKRIEQITEIAAAVGEIADHRDRAQARAAFEHVSSAIHSWAQACRKRHAEIHQIYKSLVDDITTKEVYASSIRAAVNRQGNWGNFDFYYKLAVAARKKSVTSFGEAISEIRLVLANYERQPELKAAHPFIRQLLHTVNERMERLYETAAGLGRNAYEGTMKADDPFWTKQQGEWGRGPGYKGRIAQGTEGWFHDHSPAVAEAHIQQRVMHDWTELVAQVESLLLREAAA